MENMAVETDEGTVATMTVEQEKWVWMNAIKGNEVVYLPLKKRYYAMASGTHLAGDVIRMLTADGLLKLRGDRKPVHVYEMTDQGLQYWEAVPGGIEEIYGGCESCQNVTDIKPVLLATLERFCYMCVECRETGRMPDGS